MTNTQSMRFPLSKMAPESPPMSGFSWAFPALSCKGSARFVMHQHSREAALCVLP